jgi:hypothetical protein
MVKDTGADNRAAILVALNVFENLSGCADAREPRYRGLRSDLLIIVISDSSIIEYSSILAIQRLRRGCP